MSERNIYIKSSCTSDSGHLEKSEAKTTALVVTLVTLVSLTIPGLLEHSRLQALCT